MINFIVQHLETNYPHMVDLKADLKSITEAKKRKFLPTYTYLPDKISTLSADLGELTGGIHLIKSVLSTNVQPLVRIKNILCINRFRKKTDLLK